MWKALWAPSLVQFGGTKEAFTQASLSLLLQVPAVNKQECRVLSSYSESHGILGSTSILWLMGQGYESFCLAPSQDNATNWIYPPSETMKERGYQQENKDQTILHHH